MARDDFRRRGTPLLDDEEPFHAPMLMDDDEAPIGGALRYVLQDPRQGAYERGDVVGPPDLRSQEEIDREALYAENRRRLATRPQSRTRAIHMGQRLREEHGGFAPGVAAMEALQVPMLGTADEVLGAIEAGIDPAMDYEDAQRALEENLAIGAEESPWSARAGMAAGMGLAMPLAEFAAPTAVAGASIPATLARGAVRPALAGAAMGGTAGYLRAPEGQELESTLEGAATGGLIGATGGAGLAGARALRAAYPGIAGTTAAGALEGASYGELATPGTSSGTILDQERLLDDMPLGVSTGAFMGGGLAAGSRVLSSVPRGVATLQEGIARRGARPTRRPSAPIDVDEAALDAPGLAEAAGDSASILDDIELGPEADVIAADVLAERARQPWLQRLLAEAFETDPARARLRSVGILDRQEQRRIANAFGGRERAVEALREAGLARPGLYSQNSQIAAAEAVSPAMRRDLAAIHRRVADEGRLIPGSEIADDLERLARPYEYESAPVRMRALGRSLRGRADEFRYGHSESPVTETESLLTEAGDAIDAPVTELPMDRAMDYPELLRGLDDQRVLNRRANSGPASALSPEDVAGVDTYRAQMNARNRELQATLGEDYPAYQRRNSAVRAAGFVSDGNFGLRNPASMMERLGGMSGGGGPFGYIQGALRERLYAQYRDSILATLNEIGTHPAETMATMPRVVRLLEWAATPGPDIQIGSLRIPRNAQAIANAIEMAARDGTGPATIAALEAARDERRMPEIEARQAATPEAQQSEAEEVEAYRAARRAAMHERLSPREAAATVEADPNVDQDFVRERRARMHERLRRRAEGSTP